MKTWSASAPSLRRGLGLACLALPATMAILTACGEERTVAPPSPRPPKEPNTVDELAEGEIAEGGLTAFGLPLPEGFRIRKRTKTSVTASGNASLENVANFVRQRVETKDIVTGPGKTVFDYVTVKAPRGSNAKAEVREGFTQRLRITVSLDGRQTEIHAMRMEMPKAAEGLTEDQRWERMGVRRDGKPVDPKKFE